MKSLVFKSPAHHTGVTSRVGTWLGIAFGLCFVTGLLSHGVQHDWPWPTRPVDLYRVTQGVHVISGVASIPLLLAKLWSVYPKLFERPLVRSLPHALERGSIFVLVAASFFELVTGLFNAAQNYPWSFYFPTAHYAVAWIVTGALLVHIAVKIPLIRRTLEPEPTEKPLLSRRAFLRTTALTTGVAVVATAGVTVPWLREISVLAWRSPGALPVNRTAKAANIVVPQDWRLKVGQTGLLAGGTPSHAADHRRPAHRVRRGLEPERDVDGRPDRRSRGQGRHQGRVAGEGRAVPGDHAARGVRAGSR